MNGIYLDNNATTPLHPEVLEEMFPFLRNDFGNPSSAHGYGRKVKTALNAARKRVAAALGCADDEIIFTGGGTESNNLAIAGYAAKFANSESVRNKGNGLHIITSSVEHKAILNICRYLKKKSIETDYLPVDGTGRIDMDTLKSLIKENTFLVSVMLANNEVGTIQPLKEITEIAHEKGIAVHTDAVQAFGKIPVRAAELNVDMLSISAHKFNGPKGSGALYLRKGVMIEPVIHGGTQEKGLRPGTENVPALVGLGKGCEIAVRDLKKNAEHEKMLIRKLKDFITQKIGNIKINGNPKTGIPNTLNVSFGGIEAEALVLRLDMKGVSVSTGAACSTGVDEPSHVLKAMGVPPDLAYSAIRFSVGPDNNAEEIDKTCGILEETVSEMRRGAGIQRV